jgi:hypothetical protein
LPDLRDVILDSEDENSEELLQLVLWSAIDGLGKDTGEVLEETEVIGELEEDPRPAFNNFARNKGESPRP